MFEPKSRSETKIENGKWLSFCSKCTRLGENQKKTEKYREKSVENKYIHGYKSQAKSICSMNIFLIVYASDF